MKSGRIETEVTVLLITYNHERYISQALDSILMQETNFPFEIVVLEDCSTDRTRELVQLYQRQYPQKIRLRLAERNECSNRPFAKEFGAAPSQYIAMLDGDDYWTSSKKLQKQVDFLRDHPECALCFHNALRIFEDGSHAPLLYNFPGQASISKIEDIWRANFIASCTVMFRKSAAGELPHWYYSLPFGDWPLFILCARSGKIGYIDELLGVYRIHDGGLWSKLDNVQQWEAIITFYEKMSAGLNYEFNSIVEPLLSACQMELVAARALAETVARTLPPGASILVMTRSDQYYLRRFQGYRTRAFPDRSGRPLESLFVSAPADSATRTPRLAAEEDLDLHFPADDIEAIDQLETLRAKESQFLLVPGDAFELFKRYPKLKQHLINHYLPLTAEEDICLIYNLRQRVRPAGNSEA